MVLAARGDPPGDISCARRLSRAQPARPSNRARACGCDLLGGARPVCRGGLLYALHGAAYRTADDVPRLGDQASAERTGGRLTIIYICGARVSDLRGGPKAGRGQVLPSVIPALPLFTRVCGESRTG